MPELEALAPSNRSTASNCSAARIESVAYPRFSDEIARIRWIGLELFPQLAHEDAKILGLFLRGLAPHGFEKRRVRQHAIRMARHVHEQVELLRREPYFSTVRVNTPGIHVDAEVARVERRQFLSTPWSAAATQRRTYARHQLVDAERLGHV